MAEHDDLLAADLRTVTAALIVLSGHLPLFASEPRKVGRAREHLLLRDEAFNALDRLADYMQVARPVRVHNDRDDRQTLTGSAPVVADRSKQ